MSAYSIDIATNIENVLLFGVTRHASELLQGGTPPRLDTMTVLLMCTLLAVLDWLAVSHVLSYKMCTQRLLFAQVVVSIFSNTLLTAVASSSQAVQYTQSDWWSLLTVSQSTVILIVFASLPTGAPGDTATAYTARMQSLFLFMYVENLEAQVHRVHQRTVLAAIALLVYTVVHMMARRPDQSRVAVMIARACNMLAINSMLNLALYTQYSAETKTAMLVLLLLAFDIAGSKAEWFVEIRGYAMWKAARHLQQLYDAEWQDAGLSLAVCVLALTVIRLRTSQQRAGSSEQTLTELVVLVAVNAFVQNSTPDVEADGLARGFVLLVLYLIVWDVLLGQIASK